MKDWLKKNRDTIVITGVAIATTAVVAGVTYTIAYKATARDFGRTKFNLAMIAENAGVLDKIVEYQDKLVSIIPE